MGRGVACDAPEASCPPPTTCHSPPPAGEENTSLLDDVEKNLGNKRYHELANALELCRDRGLTDQRVREFLQKCLEKMVVSVLENTNTADVHAPALLLRASSLIGDVLASDFSPWAAKCVVALIPQRDSNVPCVFRERIDAQGASALSRQQRTNDLLVQCARSVSTKVKTILQGLDLRAILSTWCQDNQFNALQAVLRAINAHETEQLDLAGTTLKSLAQRMLKQIEELKFDEVPGVLTDEGPNKQSNTDGLEGLDKMLQLASEEYAVKGQLLWRQLAIQCIQSSKLMLRRTGLDIFAKLAEIVPEKASEWLVAPDPNGKYGNILDCLTGERAHEKLVDSLRNFVMMYTRHRMSAHKQTGDCLTPAAARIIDSMVATCVGSAQHPTKDVRDAFRSALARLTVTLPYSSDSSVDKENIASRVRVAFYLVSKLLADLRSQTAGAADLALMIFTLPPPHNAYDPISMCMPSPRFLVSAGRNSAQEVASAAAADQLARVTFDLLFESLVYPTLVRNYGQLLHAFAVCLQNSSCMGRPGSNLELKNDMLHFITFCTGRLKIRTDNMRIGNASHQDASADASPGFPSTDTSGGQSRSIRTTIMQLLLDVLFFHLRSDSVAMPEKWQKNPNSLDHPNRMEWAKEGKVPMLNMTRGAFLEACEREHDLSSLIVQDALMLEEEAKCDGREGSLEHEEELWLRLQVLRFLHVEQDDNRQSQKVSFQVMERLWHNLPSELCCKWLRVLADSGDALSEEVTERAFKELVCGVDLPLLGKHGFNCFEALFGEINSRQTERYPKGRMQISGRHVVHKGIKISGKNLVRRRVSWFCVNALRRNVGTITGFDDSLGREKEPFDFENDDLHDGRSKINQLVPLKELFDCHVVEDARSPQDLRAFEIESVHQDPSRLFACDLIGMDELWRVALEALDDGVAARAGELMLELSRHLPGKFVHDFLNRIFEELEASFPLAKKPPISPCHGSRGHGRDNNMSEEALKCAVDPKAAHAPQAEEPARTEQPELVSERARKMDATRDGKHGGKGLRFSRALSLLQCLLDAQVLQCCNDVPLPHRSCVHGRPLKLTLKLQFKSRNKLQHIEQIGTLPLTPSFNHQHTPLSPPGVQSNQELSQHRNASLRSNRPQSSSLSNSPSSLGPVSGFAAVNAQNGGQNEHTFQHAYCNLTCKKLLCVGKDVFKSLRDVPLHALDLKMENGVREQASGKTLHEAGCVDGARVTILVRNDGGQSRTHGLLSGFPRDQTSILHLMSDRVQDSDAADLIMRRYKYLIANLQELENQSHDDEELSEERRSQLQRQLWRTLQSLPTADHIKRQVHDALRGEVPWESILGKCSGIWQAAYILQVVESELQVTDLYDDLIAVIPDETGIPDERLSEIKREELERRERRNSFVSRGGAHLVFGLVAEVCRTGRAWCHPTRMSWRTCTPLYLSMLRLMLHQMSPTRIDGPQQKPTVCDFPHLAQAASTNGIFTRTGIKPDAATILAGRRMEHVAASQDGSVSVSKLRVADGFNKEREEGTVEGHRDGKDHRSSTLCGEQAAQLHSCLETVVGTMLEAVVTLSATFSSIEPAGVNDTLSSAGAVGSTNSSKKGRCGSGAAEEKDDCIQHVIEEALSLVHMIINAQGSLSLRCRNDIIHCIFRSTIPGQSREASPVGAAVKSNVDALIRQLLVAYRDEKVRKLTLLTLFDAVSMGWDVERSSEEQGHGRAKVEALDMRSIVRQLVEALLQCLVMAGASSGDRSGGSVGPDVLSQKCDGGDDGESASGQLRGKEVFLWLERVIQLQKDKTFLLTADDQLDILHLILQVLAGQRDDSSSWMASSAKHSGAAKRKGSYGKKASRGAVNESRLPARRAKVCNGAAAGLLGLTDNLLARISPSRWRPLVCKYGIASVLFEEYLMARDPSNAPLLGWPDDKRGKEARRAGWKALWQIASNLDTTSIADGGKIQHPNGIEDGNARQVRAAGNGTGEGALGEGSLAALNDLVSRTHNFIENLPPPTTRTETGPDEMLVFDPWHNGLRHGQPPLVGIKNRRNTCYINSMLQQLFVIPEFQFWLEGRQATCTAAGSRPASSQGLVAAAPLLNDQNEAVKDESGKSSLGGEPGGAGPSQTESDRELSNRLQELFGYLRHSQQRFFDPGEFIKACKCPSRQQPLLDKAHTQDDTMTFLESLMDVLSNVHGTLCTDLFKVVEKDRRWVDRTNERRSITGREKEYLMLEIEDGIGDLDAALEKHFGEELMTGDNRVWNERTQSKETVWKAPFIEESSLPEVLVVQLKRFKYNMTWDGRMEPHKLNTKVEFGDVLDLSNYVRRQQDDVNATVSEKGVHVYDLQGLVVHSGQTIHSGHYYSFIKWHDGAYGAEKQTGVHPQEKQHPRESGKSLKAQGLWETQGIWYKLDDDVVTRVSEDLLKEESFGGTVESKDQFGEIKRHVHSRSAYVLFYRKRRCGANSGTALGSKISPGFQNSAQGGCISSKPSIGAGVHQAAEGSPKRQRIAKTEKSVSSQAREIDAQQGGKPKRGLDEGGGEMESALEMCFREAVDKDSLTAAQHTLAFDEDFMLWVQDVVSFAYSLTGNSMPGLARDEMQPGAGLPNTADWEGAGEMPPALTDASVGTHIKNSGTPIHLSLNGAPKSGSERDKGNIERALAGGVQLPEDLIAKICDMAVLTLVHVATRADTSSPRWRLLFTLVETSKQLLSTASASAGCRMVLERACARCAAGGGGERNRSGCGREDGPGSLPKSASLWRSWIEMLLLKHPEDKVRNVFRGLLLTAVASYAGRGFRENGGKRCGQTSSVDDMGESEGTDWKNSRRGKRKASEALDSNIEGSDVEALTNCAGQREGESCGVIERLGWRLLEIADVALNCWTESAMSAALASCQGGSRDKNHRQLHQYLLLMSDLVVQGYLSHALTRNIGEVLLKLAIQKADGDPSLARVLAEAWARMVGDEHTNSPLRALLTRVAFDHSDPLSLTRWTWLVEWLQRCSVDPASIKVTADPLPNPEKGMPAYFELYLLRRELLRHASNQLWNGNPGVGTYDADVCMRLPHWLWTETLQKIFKERPRFLCLDVQYAGYVQANGSYHYAGYLKACQRAVYTRPSGTSIFVIITAPQTRVSSSSHRPQPWLLAECKYGESWGKEGVFGGWHVLQDASVLAEALASGDVARVRSANLQGFRQILYTGGLDAEPLASCSDLENRPLLEAYVSEREEQQKAAQLHEELNRSQPILCRVEEVLQGGEMIEIYELHTCTAHKLNRVQGPGGFPNDSAWQIQSQPSSQPYFLREVWGNPPTRWAVWSGSSVESEIEGAVAGAMGSATSGGTGVGGDDPVVIDSTPNTPPSTANVPPEAGPDDATRMEHPGAGAGARSLEPAPSVSRPANYQAVLQANMNKASLGSEKDLPICVDDDNVGKNNKAQHVSLLQMKIREIAQIEVTEDEAVRLLNKAAPATLVSAQYQPSDIDNAVAAYFDQMC